MRSVSARIAIGVGVCSAVVASFVGCKTDPSSDSSTTPALSDNTKVQGLPPKPQPKPRPTVSGVPVAKADVEAAVNPGKLPPYSGATGSIEGTVRMTGDPPPDVALRIPPKCAGAEETYGKLFREGENRTAADVLIAVTGYEGYVPEKERAARVTIEHCAFSTRTVAMTYGQWLEVQNLDAKNSYIPLLQGSRYTAFMVAVPKGDPVKLYPHRVGQYELVDNMARPWMSAPTFVLKYATHTVTGLDGHFRIEGIPVGEVNVNALLPSVNLTEGKKVTVKDGGATKVDFVLKFDKEKYDGATKPHPPAAAPSSSVPKVPMVK